VRGAKRQDLRLGEKISMIDNCGLCGGKLENLKIKDRKPELMCYYCYEIIIKRRKE
jgi:hypothetical protein